MLGCEKMQPNLRCYSEHKKPSPGKFRARVSLVCSVDGGLLRESTLQFIRPSCGREWIIVLVKFQPLHVIAQFPATGAGLREYSLRTGRRFQLVARCAGNAPRSSLALEQAYSGLQG